MRVRSGKIIQFRYGGHGFNPQHLVRGLMGLAPRDSLPFDAYELYRQHAQLASDNAPAEVKAHPLHNMIPAFVRVCDEATWLDERKVTGACCPHCPLLI